MQIRLALTGMIYKKSMAVTLADRPAESQVINLIASDAQKFEDAAQFIHFLYVGPIEAIVVTYFMYQLIGISAFASMGLLFLLIPLQTYFSARMSQLRKQLNRIRDGKLKAVTDMISSITVVKLYGWEVPLVKEILKYQSEEIVFLKSTAVVKAMNEAIFFASSAFIACFAFILYSSLGGPLAPSIVPNLI